MNNLLVLYAEYAPYLHACLIKFSDLYNYEVHVVRYPLDKNAPFSFSEHRRIHFYDRQSYNKTGLESLFLKVDPQCVMVAGWTDKEYNAILPLIMRKGKIVIGVIDNLWIGSLKQIIFSKLGYIFLRKHFTKVWVPGVLQFDYMRKVGLTIDDIMTGYYSADSDLFLSRYQKPATVPKRFIYVGRLLDIKGTPTLLESIQIICSTVKSEWEFLIIGSGKYEDQARVLSSKFSNVQHKPFMQPDELAKETVRGGVFVLPSNYDAWGAVVHEFAMLGFPFILSSMVGSRNYFVTEGYNGYIFKAGNALSLADAMKRMMTLDDETLNKMSVRSNEIGRTQNTERWAAQLNSTIHSHYRK
jgi:glycosyltransferase involved in cell wall biosynthesis